MYIRTPEEFAAAVTIGTTTETLTLDFKGTIDHRFPRGTPDDVKQRAQKETCRDIAQFANTNGGCLLIGVAERRDPVTDLKVADAISPVHEPDAMRQWIEEAIRNYLVPATFSHDITIVADPRGTVLAINIPPSIHPITLWDSQRHTSECPRRTSHGKDWMNPDELQRHIMNGSRAARLTFENALAQANVREARLAGGVWQRVGNPPETTLRLWHPTPAITIGELGEQWFELEFRVGPNLLTLNLPFGLIEQAWVGTDGRVHLLLSVRVVHSYAGGEIVVERYYE